MIRRRDSRRPLALATTLAAGLALATTSARATWSIVLMDLQSGEVALGSATCLTGFDLRANTPVLITGVGGATAQSFVDARGYNRTFIRDRLLEGVAPDDIIDQLASFDTGHQTRQYGIGDTLGRVTTFSGVQAGDWKGGQVGAFQSTHAGRTTTIAYAIQGNVLAGPAVVDEAVQAVETTPGDLAAKLMAGMEAAHEMGGDGRCSCGSPPDGCGAPPAGFDPATDKSAHIAYMLIGRAGDTDACMGVYPFPRALDVAIGDLDGDGARDVLAIETSQLWRLPNAAQDSPFVQLEQAEHVANFSGTGRSVEIADYNGDGEPDALIATANGGIVIFPGAGGGAFGTGFSRPASGDVEDLALADLNGDGADDLAASVGSGRTIELDITDGSGGFLARQSVSLSAEPDGVAALDADGDGDLDLVAALPSEGEAQIIVNIDGSLFVPGASVPVVAGARFLATGDFDGNGLDDFAAAGRDSGGVSVVLQDSPGSFSRSDVATDDRIADLAAADMDGDGDTDLTFMALGGNAFGVLENDGAGGFTVLDQDYRGPGPAPGFAIGELTGDGLPDAVFAAGNTGVAATANLGPGPAGLFPAELGCAAGDYWMTFNVANQTPGDPDPTLQLRGLYDDWRQDLLGRPDAVLSIAGELPVLPPDGQSVATLRVELRDWRGEAVSFPVSLEASRGPGSTSDSEVLAVRSLGGGVFEVDVRAGTTFGIDRLRIVADDGIRPVTLMPAPLVRVGVEPADLNADGAVDVGDFFLFLDAFAQRDLAIADLTSTSNPADPAYGVPDGAVDLNDFFYYLDIFAR